MAPPQSTSITIRRRTDDCPMVDGVKIKVFSDASQLRGRGPTSGGTLIQVVVNNGNEQQVGYNTVREYYRAIEDINIAEAITLLIALQRVVALIAQNNIVPEVFLYVDSQTVYDRIIHWNNWRNSYNVLRRSENSQAVQIQVDKITSILGSMEGLVHITKVKSHTTVWGNIVADRLAKSALYQGIADKGFNSEIEYPLSLAVVGLGSLDPALL